MTTSEPEKPIVGQDEEFVWIAGHSFSVGVLGPMFRNLSQTGDADPEGVISTLSADAVAAIEARNEQFLERVIAADMAFAVATGRILTQPDLEPLDNLSQHYLFGVIRLARRAWLNGEDRETVLRMSLDGVARKTPLVQQTDGLVEIGVAPIDQNDLRRFKQMLEVGSIGSEARAVMDRVRKIEDTFIQHTGRRMNIYDLLPLQPDSRHNLWTIVRIVREADRAERTAEWEENKYAPEFRIGEEVRILTEPGWTGTVLMVEPFKRMYLLDCHPGAISGYNYYLFPDPSVGPSGAKFLAANWVCEEDLYHMPVEVERTPSMPELPKEMTDPPTAETIAAVLQNGWADDAKTGQAGPLVSQEAFVIKVAGVLFDASELRVMTAICDTQTGPCGGIPDRPEDATYRLQRNQRYAAMFRKADVEFARRERRLLTREDLGPLYDEEERADFWRCVEAVRLQTLLTCYRMTAVELNATTDA